MTSDEFNPKVFLAKIKAYWFGFFGLLIIPTCADIYVIHNKLFLSFDISNPLILAIAFLSCIIFPFGHLFSKKIFRKIYQTDSLKNKLHRYRTGQIIRMLTCEIYGILTVFVLLTTCNLLLLIFLFISIFIMIKYYPSAERIVKELDLTQHEIALIND
jgi:hypothetical protein